MIKVEESKAILERLIFDCTLQTNGSYISSEGRIIWLSFDNYKTANISNIKGVFKQKTAIKKASKKRK